MTKVFQNSHVEQHGAFLSLFQNSEPCLLICRYMFVVERNRIATTRCSTCNSDHFMTSSVVNKRTDKGKLYAICEIENLCNGTEMYNQTRII